MKTILIIACAALLLGCNKSKRAFEVYVEKIPSMDLPHKVMRGKNFDPTKIGKDEKVNGCTPAGLCILGRIEEKEENVFIVYETTDGWAKPVLITYNQFGQCLDSIFLAGNECESSATIISTSTVKFNEDHSILVSGKTTYYSLLQHGTEFLQSEDSIKSVQHTYRLNESGLFRRVKQERL